MGVTSVADGGFCGRGYGFSGRWRRRRRGGLRRGLRRRSWRRFGLVRLPPLFFAFRASFAAFAAAFFSSFEGLRAYSESSARPLPGGAGAGAEPPPSRARA